MRGVCTRCWEEGQLCEENPYWGDDLCTECFVLIVRDMCGEDGSMYVRWAKNMQAEYRGRCFTMTHLRIGEIAESTNIGRSVVRKVLCDQDWSDVWEGEGSYQRWLSEGEVGEIGGWLVEMLSGGEE